MREAVFCTSSDYAALTGGSIYNRRLVEELCAAGWKIDWLKLGDGFPFPDDSIRSFARSQFCSVKENTALIIDGLVLGVLPEIIQDIYRNYPIVGLVHHPLAYEYEKTSELSVNFRKAEAAAFNCTSHIVTTSASTSYILTMEYTVPPANMTIARPGTDRKSAAPGNDSETVSILSVGSVIPRKGYITLIDALARLSDLPWRLKIVGELWRYPELVQSLNNKIQQYGLKEKVELKGPVFDRALEALYLGADIFVSASQFEGYGMAIADAVAYGLPVIATANGAISEVVPDTIGLVVPPNDEEALADQLEKLINNKILREHYRAAARTHALTLPTWQQTRAQVEHAIGCAYAKDRDAKLKSEHFQTSGRSAA